MQWAYALLGLVSGIVLPLQAAVNAQLRQSLSSPVLAAWVSFLVGTIALSLYAAIGRSPFLAAMRVAGQVPWWTWFGGVLGAIYVLAAILVTPRLGASTLVAVTVAGQLIAALIMDHFGWFGLPLQPITAVRVLGACLLMAGVLMVMRP